MNTAAIDIFGTVFSFERAERALLELGVPIAAFEEWMARSQQLFVAQSLADAYRPFRDALESELPRVLERHGLDPSDAPTVVRQLDELEPVDGVADACGRLVARGWRLLAVTDGSRAHAQTLLTRHDLAPLFHAVLSSDDVARARPHPDVYERICARGRGGLWMLSRHSWDLTGAATAGMNTVWISDGLTIYPDGAPRPSLVARDLTEAAEQLCERRVVPITARSRTTAVAVPSA